MKEFSALPPPIIIDPEFKSAAPKVSKKQFNSLKESIKEKGFQSQFPIIRNKAGVILDGHNRIQACLELGIHIPPECFVEIDFDSRTKEIIFVREANLLRRHQNLPQRVQQALLIKADYEKLVKENMSNGGFGVQIRTPLGRVNKYLADKIDAKLTKFNQVEYGLKNGSEEQRKNLLAETIAPNKLYGQLRDEIDLKKRIALNKKLQCDFLSSPNQCELLKGDFREMSKQIASNSIPLIFTDPPYDEAHIWIYEPLGEIGNRILKPGGSLICYINQFKLFEIGDMLRKSLKHWSGYYVKLQGPKFPRHYDRQMVIKMKLLLWFVKGPRPSNPSFPNNKSSKRFMLEDLIDSTKPMKQFHKWGQSPVEASYCIEHLTSINDQIVDLFLGEGTTAIAAMNLKRRFVGIDIDPKAIRDTETNLKLNQATKD